MKRFNSKNYDQEFKVDELFIPNFNPREKDLVKSPLRVTIAAALSLIAFFILFLRLFHLQIAKGMEYRQLADGNRVQIKMIHAPRGVLYDRNYQILARNDPGFRLDKNFLTRDSALKLEITSDPAWPDLEVDHIRVYPYGEKTAHLLGYVSEIASEELQDSQFKKYKLGDRIGRDGVEEAKEYHLKGIDGGEVIEVDANGKKIRSLRTVAAIPGKNLQLSIDASLQEVVYHQLDEAVKKTGGSGGAAIVMDPQSGEVLSLVSLPSFNPQSIEDYLTAANFPLLNRNLAGKYPPGSIFKIASSLAGLSSGKITPQTEFEDTGVISIGPYTFSNWYFTQYGKTEGYLNLVNALKRSNDTYFYRLAQLVGEKTLQDVAKKLKLDQKTGIDIPGEVEGLIPDGDWKLKTFGQVWFPGDTLHLSIGQGFVLNTPMQINALMSFVASEGKFVTPHVVKDSKVKIVKDNVFKAEDLKAVRQGLAKVTTESGTAWPFFNFPIPSAGKTGTAEYGDAHGRTHAWYSGFAPLQDPKLVVTVLIEGGGEGSTNAAPVAKEIMRWYFSPDKKNLLKDI